MSLHRARFLRKAMTDSERLLWRHLRNRQMVGFKFRRQYPVGPYIVDFVCLEKKLVIELDGGQHAFSLMTDVKRTRYLETKGYRVMRFWNNQVLQETEAVLSVILEVMITPSPRPWFISVKNDFLPEFLILNSLFLIPIGMGTVSPTLYAPCPTLVIRGSPESPYLA